MVKCLIRIKTKVNVHLRMINHCYRDVKVRVLSLGPRLLGKALGVFPLFPALSDGSSTSSSGSGSGSGQSSRTPSRLSVPPQLYGGSAFSSRAGKNQGVVSSRWTNAKRREEKFRAGCLDFVPYFRSFSLIL